MASTIETEEEEIFTKSIYHFLHERDLNSGKKESIHRITIVSKLPPNKSLDSRQLVAEFFDKFMDGFVDANKVTGLLLLYPNHAIHILESTDHTILEIVRLFNLMEMNEIEDSMLMFSRSRILVVSRNINQRLYVQYNTKILDMEPANVNLFESNDSDYKVVIDVMNQLTKLGVYLFKEPLKDQREFVPEIFSLKLSEVLQNIRDRVPDLIPQQIIVGYLAELSQDSCLIRLSEFIEYYEKPYSVLLESDLVWPSQRNTFLFM